MITEEYCKKLAKRNLSEKRYQHTLNVESLSIRLAKRYHADPEKASIAALLHDICKERPKDELLQTLREHAIMTNNAAEKPQGIWHAAAAMVYAREILGIQDQEILDAIRYHTSGRAGMTTLDKVLYMADMCCEDRSYPEVDKLRKLLKTDLDDAMICALQYSIRWLEESGKTIDDDSRHALEDMKQKYLAAHDERV